MKKLKFCPDYVDTLMCDFCNETQIMYVDEDPYSGPKDFTRVPYGIVENVTMIPKLQVLMFVRSVLKRYVKIIGN